MNFDIREDQQKRKDQLKSITTKIRTKKQEYKDACKEHQKLHKSFNLDKWLSISDCWYDGDITKTVRVIISKSIFNLKDLQQKLNDLSPILVTESEILIVVKLSQLKNASSLIVVTLFIDW